MSEAEAAALARDMTAMAHKLDALPDDQEWTQDGLAALDDLRRAAIHLADLAEATIKTFEGQK